MNIRLIYEIQRQGRSTGGFALISTMFMMVVLMALLGAFFVMTNLQLAGTRFSSNSTKGFYAAEAGLNQRAESIRDRFLDYNRPTGASPTTATACQAGNMGSGDFACTSLTLDGHTAGTYVNEDPTNPVILTIPPGERYQNLNAQEYRYTARSTSTNARNDVEAILELKFKSRLVPLFQFVAFYNKDLEINPGPAMSLNGPIHVNGDLYTESGAAGGLNITGQVTTSGSFFRGRKNANTCTSAGPVRVNDPAPAPASLRAVSSCNGSQRRQVIQSDVTSWDRMIQIGVLPVTVPAPDFIDPTPGQTYWDRADLRLVLNLNASHNPITTNSPRGVEVRTVTNTVDTTKTTALSACVGSIGGFAVNTTNTFRNNRENKTIRMLEVDMRRLFDCIHTQGLFGTGKTLDDSSDGGIVLFLTVSGLDSTVPASRYGVRVRNGATLQSFTAGYPAVRGITIVSDQAFFSMGDYNSVGKIPAAFLVDSVNPLSNNWNTATDGTNTLSARTPTNTAVYAAILSGTDTTGDIEGTGGQNGAYNGGLENFFRFHEDWTPGARTFLYRGSLVSLNRPRHVNGDWFYGGTQYTAPVRNWNYDTDFNDAAKLPPLTPRFVYLRQELFVRDYEQ